jgi:DNA-directed RNA polymerase subunit omega
MNAHRPTMMQPPIEVLLSKVDSKFTLVALTAQRARQINSYFGQLGTSLGSVIPPQVQTASSKPVSIALEEINQDRIVPVYNRDQATSDDVPESTADDATDRVIDAQAS